VLDSNEPPGAGHFESEPENRGNNETGFTLVESLIAILVFGLGLMFVGQLMFDGIGITTLARSKNTATVAAENRMEILAAKYQANPADSDLTLGNHGPLQVEFLNPVDQSKINRYNVAWTVANVPDPRAGKVLKGVQVTVRVTPIGVSTQSNVKTGLNKVIILTSIISLKTTT
jgi:prepilin-type N-terminal cleavage/methylation domain-containing protein